MNRKLQERSNATAIEQMTEVIRHTISIYHHTQALAEEMADRVTEFADTVEAAARVNSLTWILVAVGGTILVLLGKKNIKNHT